MDARILCQIIAKQIDPTKFQLWGYDIHWLDESYDTPENQKIIEDAKADYDNLALPYIKQQQINEIKIKMRVLLAEAIGDYGDNLADVSRALALSEGIRNGSITDANIIKGYADYCADLITMYGGAQAILDVLNTDLQGLKKHLAPYYPAKDEVNNATTEAQATSVVITPVIEP
jgi:hypothetical protein